MLINNSEYRTLTCCVLLMLTTIVANRASGVLAMEEGQVEDQSTEEMQDWRQPLPTVKRAMSLLNKLVMVAHRANTKAKQDQQRLHSRRFQSADSNQVNQELDSIAKISAEVPDDDHYQQQKTAAVPQALPHMGFERRGQKSSRVFWRCYFNAVTCFR